MDRIKSQLTQSLIEVDRARNYYRDTGCDAELARLITEAYVSVDAARNAIFDRARATKRPAYLPDDDYPDLIPVAHDACPGCVAGALGSTTHGNHVCALGRAGL